MALSLQYRQASLLFQGIGVQFEAMSLDVSPCRVRPTRDGPVVAAVRRPMRLYPPDLMSADRELQFLVRKVPDWPN